MSQALRSFCARSAYLIAIFALLLSVLVMPAASARATPSAPLAPMACAPDGVQTSGAIYRICMPGFGWNGDLMVYAHGYVPATEPVAIPEDQLYLPDGTYIPDAANLLGYAFATTSYSVNGLAIKQGLADLADLVNIFRAAHPTLRRVVLVGVSEGGLITTLATEQYSNVFNGGMAGCGPIGDFRGQLNYVADFRVVFDYFFPGLIPGSPVAIPPSLIDTWDDYYLDTVLPTLMEPSSEISVTQLLDVTAAPYDPVNPATKWSTISQELWYSVFATNDAVAKLGGQPFDNQVRVYSGSLDDIALNAGVQRFTASPAALAEVEASYQTAGRPAVPLVTIHTTLDQTVPYWHETLYRAKVVANNFMHRHDLIPVVRYGHCNFTSAEVIQALQLLQSRINNPPPTVTATPTATSTSTETPTPTATSTPTATPTRWHTWLPLVLRVR